MGAGEIHSIFCISSYKDKKKKEIIDIMGNNTLNISLTTFFRAKTNPLKLPHPKAIF